MQIKTLFTIIFAVTFLINESAFARAGGKSFGGGRSSYSSQGSRGSRTYDGGSANGKSYSGMDKTTTSKPSETNPNATPNNQNNLNNSQTQNQNPSFFQRNPMMSTFGAALAGTWLGSMLFGSHAGASTMNGADGAISSGGGMFSGLMPMILIGILIWLVIRFANRNRSSGGVFNNNQADSGYNTPNMKIVSQNISLPESEKQKFAAILLEVQSAWSIPDMDRLKKSVTPEILKYFSDALHQNQSQNLQNKVENLQVLEVTISEAWQEEDLQFATATLQWSALDYTVNLGKNIDDPLYITEGNKNNPSNISEAWTFVRFGTEGNWIVSAIAQIS